METIKLAGGSELPTVGFGTYLIPAQEAEQVVFPAHRAGYRHVDTAEGYHNERGVGTAIRKAMDELDLARHQVFVTTKLWPGNPAWGDPPKTTAEVLTAFAGSLERLQTGYVDLYLTHAPFAGPNRLDQWRAMLELQDSGQAKAIGVSNFGVGHLEEIEAAGLPLPEVNQIELHPWSQKPELIAHMQTKGIRAIAYSSLVPLSSWRSEPGQDSAKTAEMKAAGARADSPFRAMAATYGVSEAQVLLRWAVQRGFGVIPKSTQEERMRLNLDLFSFEIDASDMTAMAQMDRGEGVAWAVGDPMLAD
ncbi:MAG: aldo/keto reductase [Gemmataceae bacterium]